MVAKGENVYICDCDSCKGGGYSWSQSELNSALESDVVAIVYDDNGRQAILDTFKDGSTTKFDMKKIYALVTSSVQNTDIKDWQVGECIACAYLRDHRDCFIPWNGRRDLRTPNASLPGVDICGLRIQEGVDQFFFCEVKTSQEEAYPPQVASGRMNSGGLVAQVEELRDDKNIRETVINYLAYRAKNSDWESRFKNALIYYLRDYKNFSIFGFMIRDVMPNEKDLKRRVQDVAEDTHGIYIEFLALYLPLGQIASLPSSIRQYHESR